MFKKAERKKSKLRLAICAPSGAGKTYSALLMAKGLGGKVAVIDTENGSADLYSHLFDYDVAQITGTYEPSKYIEAIKCAEKAGYSTIIIDSLSHAWNAEGGILDLQSKKEQASKSKNGYYAWRDVTPLHNALVTAILGSNMHVITTIRSKTAYETGTKDGKFFATKVGLAPIQRDGMEYEFTVVLDISNEGHLCSASKDRTGMFDGKNFVITESTGKDLLKWLEDGKDVEHPVIENEIAENKEQPIKEKFKIVLSQINNCDNLVDLKNKYDFFYLKLSRYPDLQRELASERDRIKSFIEDAQKKVTEAMGDVPQ